MQAGAPPAPREAGIPAGIPVGISAGPATGTGTIRPGWGSGRRRDRHRGFGAAVKQVPQEEGQAEGSFVEESRDEGSAGL